MIFQALFVLIQIEQFPDEFEYFISSFSACTLHLHTGSVNQLVGQTPRQVFYNSFCLFTFLNRLMCFFQLKRSDGIGFVPKGFKRGDRISGT